MRSTAHKALQENGFTWRYQHVWLSGVGLVEENVNSVTALLILKEAEAYSPHRLDKPFCSPTDRLGKWLYLSAAVVLLSNKSDSELSIHSSLTFGTLRLHSSQVGNLLNRESDYEVEQSLRKAQVGKKKMSRSAKTSPGRKKSPSQVQVSSACDNLKVSFCTLLLCISFFKSNIHR